MPLGVVLVLAALAAYRATRLVTLDTLFERQREQIFDRWPPDLDRARLTSFVLHGQVEKRLRTTPAPKVSKIGQLAYCPWCVGAHVTAGVVALLTLFVSIPLPVLVWAGLSAVVGFLAMIDAALL